ncbi:hypothetical protein KKG31_02920 [Patescibacteria group bacterium]|nr:hypothetical protein [Patescibacteria group bacterium]MBU1758114.1 hypothetical protein [Patescibacteria group bacterium]
MQRETKDLKTYAKESNLQGALVCNPPYGLRMQTFDLEILYNTIANIFKNNPQLNG